MALASVKSLSRRDRFVSPSPFVSEGREGNVGRTEGLRGVLKRSVVMRTLQGERVVVTGGSRGLGLAIVEALLARAAEVTVVARDPERLAATERLGAAARRGELPDPGRRRTVLAPGGRAQPLGGGEPLRIA